jgi:hypothetical protein
MQPSDARRRRRQASSRTGCQLVLSAHQPTGFARSTQARSSVTRAFWPEHRVTTSFPFYWMFQACLSVAGPEKTVDTSERAEPARSQTARAWLTRNIKLTLSRGSNRAASAAVEARRMKALGRIRAGESAGLVRAKRFDRIDPPIGGYNPGGAIEQDQRLAGDLRRDGADTTPNSGTRLPVFSLPHARGEKAVELPFLKPKSFRPVFRAQRQEITTKITTRIVLGHQKTGGFKWSDGESNPDLLNAIQPSSR